MGILRHRVWNRQWTHTNCDIKWHILPNSQTSRTNFTIKPLEVRATTPMWNITRLCGHIVSVKLLICCWVWPGFTATSTGTVSWKFGIFINVPLCSKTMQSISIYIYVSTSRSQEMDLQITVEYFFAPLNGAKHNLLYTWHPKSNQFVSQITYIWYLIPHWKVFLIPINFSRLRLKCLVRCHWDAVIKSTAQGMVHLFKQHHLEWKSQGSPSVHYMHCLPPSLRPFWHHLFYRWYSSNRDLLDLQGPGIDRVNGVSVVFDASCGICPFWILFLFLACSFLKQEKTTWSAISRFQSNTHHCELYKACDFQDQESCVGRTHNISRGFFWKFN